MALLQAFIPGPEILQAQKSQVLSSWQGRYITSRKELMISLNFHVKYIYTELGEAITEPNSSPSQAVKPLSVTH